MSYNTPSHFYSKYGYKDDDYYSCNICKAKVYKQYMERHLLVHGDSGCKKQYFMALDNSIKSTDDQLIEAFMKSLTKLGYEIEINPVIAFDRKGFQITILEPKGKEDVQSKE